MNFDDTDFLVHLGDAFHGIESADAILDLFLDPLSKALGHRRPLLYARGNHEARGPAARSLMDYLALPENRFYYARDHGPIHFIVLDTGEDKDDDTNVYSHLNRFKPYRAMELDWFREHVQQEPRLAAAPFRVLLMHAPNWRWVEDRNAWTAVANNAGIDLAVSGHTHRFAHTAPGQDGKGYHQLVLAPDQLARIQATSTELKVTVQKQDGALAESFTIFRRLR